MPVQPQEYGRLRPILSPGRQTSSTFGLSEAPIRSHYARSDLYKEFKASKFYTNTLTFDTT